MLNTKMESGISKEAIDELVKATRGGVKTIAVKIDGQLYEAAEIHRKENCPVEIYEDVCDKLINLISGNIF